MFARWRVNTKGSVQKTGVEDDRIHLGTRGWGRGDMFEKGEDIMF